ncbi:NO-inducible flavohemoprotein [Terrihabitans rhizophilus]|uniref:Flavohemoprotein n=1 Tax=Terrihabitans rhizophilus TaxID=3092662 RepID=A0ABU4RLN8_9HYPH|nr:NO-inducible flavohemoprotein [Terrihabitans sp. PJ23]MDX6805744.1 NO-inducible flavohemoprotein [Terrihabitans sp. PJ23]
MASQLSPRTVEIVKATVPALEVHGFEIVRAMYARMFEDPAIRDLFNQSHHGETGSQPRALTDAILAYARNIENLGVLGAAVERIAQKHVGLQILPEHYPAVANALLAAIKQVLGDAATDEVLAAWGEAYWFLADILIAREQALYKGLETADGGWAGWRDFRVAEKIPESSIITSFVLVPVDGGAVIRHKPGQYLTFWLDIPGQHPLKRNYSISNAPDGRAYRISVKREPNGVVSGWLHDEVEVGHVLKVSPPAGEFYLDGTPQRPVVLVSGGVGLTPMLSMLHSVAEGGAEVPVHFVHGALNGGTHALGTEVRRVAVQPNLQATIFYLEPHADDRARQDYDEAGLITVDWLKRNTPFGEAEFYLCGPKPFLAHFVHGLQQEGVAPTRIHYEFFGPADELLAA